MRRRVATLASLALGPWFPTSAPALPADPPLPPTQGVPPPGAPAPDAADQPPYQADLERLAERLGTLALLRDLCRDGDAAAWRNKMTALLDAEAKSGPRRDRLVAAVNRGFRGYAASYHACTPSARLVIARSLADSERLTRELATRFGGT